MSVSPFWNERLRALDPYVPGEQPRDRRYVKLNTNENPYPPSPRVLEALREAATADLRLYPDPGALQLRRAIADRYGTVPERVFAGNGSDEVLAFAFAAFFGKRSGKRELLLFPDLSYSFYPVYAGLWGISYKRIPVTEDFSIDAADYCVPAGGVVFPNPNAPTGRALSRAEVLSIVDYHRKEHNVVLVDEAYVDFGAESVADAIADYPNLLVVHTLSKARSLAGLRVGYALGQEELVEGLRRVKDSFNSYPLDRLALAGATAAVTDAEYYDQVNRRVAATRDRVAAALAGLGFTVLPSAANFLFVRHPDHAGAALFAALRERGILVRHFNKERIAEYLRVSIGTDEEMDAFLAACGALT